MCSDHSKSHSSESSSPAYLVPERTDGSKVFAELPQPVQIALLLALDGHALGGSRLQFRDHSAAALWSQKLSALMASEVTVDPAVSNSALSASCVPGPAVVPRTVRLPVNSAVEDLNEQLDLVATLDKGKSVFKPGLMQLADAGLLQVPLPRSQSPRVFSFLCSALDSGCSARRLRRAGVNSAVPDARFTLLLLDDDTTGDVSNFENLLDRLTFSFVVDTPAEIPAAEHALLDTNLKWSWEEGFQALQHLDLASIRDRASRLVVAKKDIVTLSTVADVLGISSVRKLRHCLRVMRLMAAIEHRDVCEGDITEVVKLCLGWCATRVPEILGSEQGAGEDEGVEDPEHQQSSEDNDRQEAPDNIQDEQPGDADADADAHPNAAGGESDDLQTADNQTPDGDSSSSAQDDFDDQAPEAAQQEIDPAMACLPEDLLADLAAKLQLSGRQSDRSSSSAGRRNAMVLQHKQRGRPIGVERGKPTGSRRVNFSATLRAAVPWQKLRRQQHADRSMADSAEHALAGKSLSSVVANDFDRRVFVRPEDLHVTRFQQKRQNVTIFVVDASGSAAFQRLAEAKGAVELMLADCYVRRDQVALIVFQGRCSTLVLSPTRSLARTRRELAQLPGGGGTPLASALDQAELLVRKVRNEGNVPVLCLLSDGRANVDRDGIGGRQRAAEQALQAATSVGSLEVRSVVIDIAPRQSSLASDLASAMKAKYVALPRANSQAISQTLKTEMTENADSDVDAANLQPVVARNAAPTLDNS